MSDVPDKASGATIGAGTTAPSAVSRDWRTPLKQFHALTKPRVIQLIVFCALIGMVLAVPGVPSLADVKLALIA